MSPLVSDIWVSGPQLVAPWDVLEMWPCWSKHAFVGGLWGFEDLSHFPFGLSDVQTWALGWLFQLPCLPAPMPAFNHIQLSLAAVAQTTPSFSAMVMMLYNSKREITNTVLKASWRMSWTRVWGQGGAGNSIKAEKWIWGCLGEGREKRATWDKVSGSRALFRWCKK